MNGRALILKMGGKYYELYKPLTVKNPATGSKGKDFVKVEPNLFAMIQPTGSKSNVRGEQLQATPNQGDIKIADYFMYTEDEMIEKDRVLYKGKFYEIRSCEEWELNFLKFYKSYLMRVDNQNVKK